MYDKKDNFVPTVRTAIHADSEAITKLLDALNLAEGYDLRTDAAALSAALFAPAREVNLAALVAEQDGRVIGVLLYYPGYDTLSASRGYHLADMVVSEFYRRRGVGKLLLQSLAQQALAEEKPWISLTVLKNNAPAKEFYDALGFSQVSVDFFAIGKTALAQM